MMWLWEEGISRKTAESYNLLGQRYMKWQIDSLLWYRKEQLGRDAVLVAHEIPDMWDTGLLVVLIDHGLPYGNGC